VSGQTRFMTLVIVIALAALAAALFLVRVSRGHAEAISNLDDLNGRTRPVDVEGFRNLLNPAETLFLRQNLPAKAFRMVQRERTLAAAEYVQRIAQNAAILLRLGQASRAAASDPEVVQAATAIIERALLVRMIATQALVKLYVQSLVPGIGFSSLEVIERYLRLTDSTIMLVRLQRPAYAGRVGAML
jgi:hypothetical protein